MERGGRRATAKILLASQPRVSICILPACHVPCILNVRICGCFFVYIIKSAMLHTTMTIGIDFGRCSRDPETCCAVQQIFEQDAFYEAVQTIEPTATDIRSTLAKVVIMCTHGNCPGQNPGLAMEVLDRHNRQE